MYFDSKKIYGKIDKMRLDKGWSLYRLAELAGISVNSLYSWRDRNSSPTLYLIENIANAFSVSPVTLLLEAEDAKAVDEEHGRLIEYWNLLNAEQKKSLMNMLKSFIREND